MKRTSLVVLCLSLLLSSAVALRQSTGIDAWTTYGHDSQRTSASPGGNITTLTELWRYRPSNSCAAPVGFYVATDSAVYVRWNKLKTICASGQSAIDKLAPDETLLATNPFLGHDADLKHWPTMSSDRIFINEDTLQSIRSDTLASLNVWSVPCICDTWGQSLFDESSQRLFTANARLVDGPALYVGAHSLTLSRLWAQNQFGIDGVQFAQDTSEGAIAFDNGILFYAPKYNRGTYLANPPADGLYAFNGSTGALLWHVPSTPGSSISAQGGIVYGTECTDSTKGVCQVVGRSETTGALIWSQPINWPGKQAPVLAGGLVIVGSEATDKYPTADAQFRAYNGATGVLAWSRNIQVPNIGWNFFIGGVVGWTYAAAALTSSTLVVTAHDGIHVLDLATGADRWFGGTPSIALGKVHSPIIVGGRLYVQDGREDQTYMGGLIALEDLTAPGPPPPPPPPPPSPGDTTAPTVSITSPVNGQVVARRGTVSVSATATDNVGVAGVSFYVNGILQVTDTTTPYGFTWSVPGAPRRSYVIQAVAFDAAGNSASSQVSVSTGR